MTGSTISHVNMISLVGLVRSSILYFPSCSQHLSYKVSVALHSAIRLRFPPPKLFHFLSEWLVLVLPPLLSITIFAERPGTLSASLFLPTALLCFFFPLYESGTPLPSGGVVLDSPTSERRIPSPQNDKYGQQKASPTEELGTTHLSALSTYRAHMMLMTTLAILAVDFPVFPRALAKCETYGVSLVRSPFLMYIVITSHGVNHRWTWASARLCFRKESCLPFHSSKIQSIRECHLCGKLLLCSENAHLYWHLV
jgi:glucosaminylphosphatidylinositol acyltransferase